MAVAAGRRVGATVGRCVGTDITGVMTMRVAVGGRTVIVAFGVRVRVTVGDRVMVGVCVT